MPAKRNMDEPRTLKGSTVVGASKKKTQEVVNAAWPSPAQEAGHKRAKATIKKAKKAAEKARKSKRMPYYD